MPLTILLRKAPVPAAVTRLPAFVVLRKKPPDPVPFPSSLTPQAQAWLSLHAIADDAVPALQGLILETMAQAQAIIPADVLTSLAMPGNEGAATAQLTSAWDLAVGNTLAPKVDTQLRRLFLQAAHQSAQTFTTRLESLRTPLPETVPVPPDVAERLTGDLMAPRAVAWAGQESALLVTRITDTTRQAIQQSVQQAMAHGQTIGELTRDIRGVLERVPVVMPALTSPQAASYLNHLMGLTPRQVGAVDTFRRGLVLRGWKPERIDQAVARKAAQARRQRAELIARTETITAAAAGQQAFWEASEQAGLLDAARARRRWVVTPDDRLCPTCAAIPGMNPEGVGLKQPFQTPVGPLLHPTAHPACRCAVVLTFVRAAPLSIPSLVEQLPVPRVRAPRRLEGQMAIEAATAEHIRPVGGTTGAALYRGTDDVLRVVKTPKVPLQAYTEHVANRAYTALGIEAPASTLLTQQGKLAGVGTTFLEGGVLLKEAGLTRERARKVLDGFVADVWLANRDVMGLDLDNILVRGDRLIRLDQGGSLLFRAQGAKKPAAHLKQLLEWEGLRQRQVNPAYARVFAAAELTPADELALMRRQVAELVALRDRSTQFADLVPTVKGVTAAQRKQMIKILHERSILIEEQLVALEQRQGMVDLMGQDGYERMRQSKEMKSRGRKIPAMPEHEQVALFAYTTEDPQWSYHTMNRALWAEASPQERQRMAPLNSAAASGLRKMEGYTGLLYRGSKGLPQAFIDQHHVGATLAYPSFTSASTSQTVAWNFGRRYRFYIETHGGAYDVRPLSDYQFEAEKLFFPGTQFRVTRIEDLGETRYFYLEEIPQGGAEMRKYTKARRTQAEIHALIQRDHAWAEAHLTEEQVTAEERVASERMARKTDSGASAITIQPASQQP